MAMAKVRYICKVCGEVNEYRAYKPSSKSARNFEEWAEGSFDMCPACRKAAERREKAQTVAKYCANIPELTGSTRQISWANDLRIKLVCAADSRIKNSADEGHDVSIARDYISWIVGTKTESRFWIDNQDNDLFYIAATKEFMQTQKAQDEEVSA